MLYTFVICYSVAGGAAQGCADCDMGFLPSKTTKNEENLALAMGDTLDATVKLWQDAAGKMREKLSTAAR